MTLKTFFSSLCTLLFCIALSSCASPTPSTPGPAQADFGPAPAKPESLIRAYLRETLVDPDSLRDLRVGTPRRAYTSRRTDLFQAGLYGYIVPVEYNAKNRMGGYAGKQIKVAFVRNDQIQFFINGQFIHESWSGITFSE